MARVYLKASPTNPFASIPWHTPVSVRSWATKRRRLSDRIRFVERVILKHLDTNSSPRRTSPNQYLVSQMATRQGSLSYSWNHSDSLVCIEVGLDGEHGLFLKQISILRKTTLWSMKISMDMVEVVVAESNLHMLERRTRQNHDTHIPSLSRARRGGNSLGRDLAKLRSAHDRVEKPHDRRWMLIVPPVLARSCHPYEHNVLWRRDCTSRHEPTPNYNMSASPLYSIKMALTQEYPLNNTKRTTPSKVKQHVCATLPYWSRFWKVLDLYSSYSWLKLRNLCLACFR